MQDKRDLFSQKEVFQLPVLLQCWEIMRNFYFSWNEFSKAKVNMSCPATLGWLDILILSAAFRLAYLSFGYEIHMLYLWSDQQVNLFWKL